MEIINKGLGNINFKNISISDAFLEFHLVSAIYMAFRSVEDFIGLSATN